MSYRRNLLRVANVGSACWVAWWVWHYATTCSLIGMSGSKAITCRWETAAANGVTVVSRTAPALPVLWDMAVRTIGVPACVIVAATAVWWVIQRLNRPA